MRWSDAQYDHRAEWAALHPAGFNEVPSRFDETAPIDWTPVWSLTADTVRYLPTGYCYYGAPHDQDPPAYHADSNGCAAGTTLTEAVLQGTLELVERDAVAMWWYNRIPRPSVDLDTLTDPYIDDLRHEYAELGRDVAVLDITNDLAIPTFVAVSWRNDGGPERIVFGFGAHLDARVAILRALTELNQIVVAAGQARHDPEPVDDRRRRRR